MKLDEEDPSQQQMIAHLRADAAMRMAEGDEAVAELAPYEAGPGPYLQLGSHPDIVTRVWDVLGAGGLAAGRCILFGTPALLHPERGVVLALAYGTEYVLHLPAVLAAEAIERGYQTKQQWSTGDATDLAEIFGPGWVFGRWLDEEEAWLQAAAAIAKS